MVLYKGSDEEPLIQPSPQSFVRLSALRRSTRRPKTNLSINIPPPNQQDENSFDSGNLPIHSPPLQTQNLTTITSSIRNQHERDNSTQEKTHFKISEVSGTIAKSSLSGNDRLNYLPPLPPTRLSDDTSHRIYFDNARKLHCKGDHFTRGSASQLQQQRSPSPFSKSKGSFIFFGESANQSPQSHSKFQVDSNSEIGLHRNCDARQSKDSWNQRILAAFRRPLSPNLRKYTPPSTDALKQSEILQQLSDGKRIGCTTLSRPSSPRNFHHYPMSEEEKYNNYTDKSMPSHTQSFSRPSGRSSPIRSLTPQASPLTYHRPHNVPDPPLDGTFKRFRSFPLHRKQVYHINCGKDNDSDHRKFSKSISFRRSPAHGGMVTSVHTEEQTKFSTVNHVISNKKGETNCFALLPTSKPNYLKGKTILDPETVSLPMQMNSRNEEREANGGIHEAGSTLERINLISRTERANSLPDPRRDRHLSSPEPVSEYVDNSQDFKDRRCHSLSSQAQQNRGESNPSQNYESTDDERDFNSLGPPPVQDNYPARLVRSSGSIRSQDSFVSYISDASLSYEVTSQRNSPTDEHNRLHRDLSRCSSSASSVAGPDIYECFDNAICAANEQHQITQSNADHISYLLKNDSEYISCLENMLDTYEVMCVETPSHIRQHFDVLFKQLGILVQFHSVLQLALEEAGNSLEMIADAFKDEQFQCYKQYMIMTPTVQKDFYRYSTYFDEHYPHVKRDFLKPSVRINFYSMLLGSLKKHATEQEAIKLDCAVNYLSNLKKQANTEMTIASVVNSPVDLRLCGNMINIGELFCFGTGPLQKRKYHMILFENILLIASSKTSSFKYKTHYRIEQLDDVKAMDEDPKEFALKVLTEGQASSLNFKFKVRLTPHRDQWVTEFQKIISQTKLQYSGDKMKNVIHPFHKSHMLPLSLYVVYPQLLRVMTDKDSSNTNTKVPNPDSLCQQLIMREKSYIKQISSLLNPDIIEPPEGLTTLLEKFYHLHKKQLIPDLERTQEKGFSEVLNCLYEYTQLFQIYADYFVVRSQLNSKLERSSEASLYISPVQHFTGYLYWLKSVNQIDTYKTKAQMTLQRLKDIVLGSQVRLLSESIINGRIDFFRSGNLLRNDTMEVKTKRRGVPEGLYQVLLFEKIIILTKPKVPFYEYVWDIWLNQVNLGPPSNSDKGFKLEVRQGRGRDAVTFEFRAASNNIQQIWIKSLQQELFHQAEDIRKRASMLSI